MGQLLNGYEVIRCHESIGDILRMAVDRHSNSRDLERVLGIADGSISIDLYPEDECGDILCCLTTISGRALAERSIDSTEVQSFAAMVCAFVERLAKPELSAYAFDGCDVEFISHGILNDSDDRGNSDEQFESVPYGYSFQGR
jgi:hypothetical protein